MDESVAGKSGSSQSLPFVEQSSRISSKVFGSCVPFFAFALESTTPDPIPVYLMELELWIIQPPEREDQPVLYLDILRTGRCCQWRLLQNMVSSGGTTVNLSLSLELIEPKAPLFAYGC